VVESSRPLKRKALNGKRMLIILRVATQATIPKLQHSIYSSQITNINFNSFFSIKKLETQNHLINNQAENRSKTNYQRIQEQLPLLALPSNEMYQKLLSIKHIALVPLAPLQPPYPY